MAVVGIVHCTISLAWDSEADGLSSAISRYVNGHRCWPLNCYVIWSKIILIQDFNLADFCLTVVQPSQAYYLQTHNHIGCWQRFPIFYLPGPQNWRFWKAHGGSRKQESISVAYPTYIRPVYIGWAREHCYGWIAITLCSLVTSSQYLSTVTIIIFYGFQYYTTGELTWPPLAILF